MSRHFHASHFLLRDPAFHLKRTSHLFAEFIIFELKLFPFEKNSVLWKAPIWSLFISKELLITLMKVPWAYGFPGQIISKHIFWHQKFHVLCYWIFSAYYSPIIDECQTQAAKFFALPWEITHVKTIPLVPHNTHLWVSSFAWLYCGFKAHLIYGKEDMTWNSHTSRGVLLKLSWWTCSLDRVETFANWL